MINSISSYQAVIADLQSKRDELNRVIDSLQRMCVDPPSVLQQPESVVTHSRLKRRYTKRAKVAEPIAIAHTAKLIKREDNFEGLTVPPRQGAHCQGTGVECRSCA